MTDKLARTPADIAVAMEVLNDAPLPEGYTGPAEGAIDFGVFRGLSPALPIECKLSERVNAVVEVVAVDWIANPLYDQQVREGKFAPQEIPVFTWREPPDGKFYRAMSGNKPNMRAASIMAKALVRISGVTAKIVGFETKSNDGYTFAGVDSETAFGR